MTPPRQIKNIVALQKTDGTWFSTDPLTESMRVHKIEEVYHAGFIWYRIVELNKKVVRIVQVHAVSELIIDEEVTDA